MGQTLNSHSNLYRTLEESDLVLFDPDGFEPIGVASEDNGDEMDTMMDLAKAYIAMGDVDSAGSALGEILKSGDAAQKSEAETLIRKIT